MGAGVVVMMCVEEVRIILMCVVFVLVVLAAVKFGLNTHECCIGNGKKFHEVKPSEIERYLSKISLQANTN